MNWIKKLIKAIKRASMDPCKDIRCKGCVL